MKNLLTYPTLKVLALLILFGTASCDKDDEKEPIPAADSNTDYNNVKYNIKNGFVQDGSTVDVFFNDEAADKTHYNYNFILTDGTPQFEGDDVVSMNDGKIMITAALLSPGTDGFKTGEFKYFDWSDMIDMEEEEFLEAYKDKYFFPLALIFTDSDGDQNWEEEKAMLVKGGTFKVSGSAPNYTTEYNFTLADGKKISGTFTGKFNEVQD